MARNRTTMLQVKDAIETLATFYPAGITSNRIAEATNLSVGQSKDALKVLSKQHEISRVKDPDSKRGFLYKPLQPPAWIFVDPTLYQDQSKTVAFSANGWRERRKFPRTGKNDFSTLDLEQQNRAEIYEE